MGDRLCLKDLFIWFGFKRTVLPLPPSFCNTSSSSPHLCLLPLTARRQSPVPFKIQKTEPTATEKPSDHRTLSHVAGGLSTSSGSEHFKQKKVCLSTKGRAGFAWSYTQGPIYCAFVDGWAASRCCLLLFFDANSSVERQISGVAAFVRCSPSHLGGARKEIGGWRG